MEVFQLDEGSSKNDDRNKMSFLTSKGVKRSITLCIILTILSIIYTFINKLSTSSIDNLFGSLFDRMVNMSPEQIQKFLNFSKSPTVRT